MNLNGHAPELLRGLSDLTHVWDDTREVWDDMVAEEIYRRFQDPLERNVHATLEAMNRLGPILEKAKQDCE